MAESPVMAGFALTVAVPCRDRLESLTACLGSIGQAVEFARGQPSGEDVSIEVIVVDDHSEPGFAPAVRRRFPWVRVIPSHGEGPGAARNSALRTNTADCYLFTDSDCVVAHDWCLRATEWYRLRSAPAAQGLPWLYQQKQNLALGLCEQRLYEHMFSTYLNGKTTSMIDPRCLVLTSDLLKATGHEIFAEWIRDASAEDRVVVRELLDKAGAIAWAPELIVYHEDPADEECVWRQKYRHGSGRLHMWPDPPDIAFLMQRYFSGPIGAGIDADYVLPAHLAFLSGYRDARHMSGTCQRNKWWDDLTGQLESTFPATSKWLPRLNRTLGLPCEPAKPDTSP